MNFLFVALGGAIGAMGRYAISLIPIKTEFPFLTFLTNVIGAILIEGKSYFLGGIYMALSVICCVCGILCRKKLALMLQ